MVADTVTMSSREWHPPLLFAILILNIFTMMPMTFSYVLKKKLQLIEIHIFQNIVYDVHEDIFSVSGDVVCIDIVLKMYAFGVWRFWKYSYRIKKVNQTYLSYIESICLRMVLLNVFKKSKIVINEKAVTLLIGFVLLSKWFRIC